MKNMELQMRKLVRLAGVFLPEQNQSPLVGI